MSYELRPRATFVCRECERECKNEHYAINRQNGKVCDECAYSADLRMVENDKKVFAYLSERKGVHHLNSEKFFLSNWTGRKIASVIACWESCAGHCGKQTFVLAIGENGRLLSGRGPGVGMYCTLREIKNWPKNIGHLQPFFRQFQAYKTSNT